jgi:kumamolisin
MKRTKSKPDGRHAILPGSDSELLANSRAVGPVDPNELSSLTVRVRSAAADGALETFVQKLYAQPLAKRQYLTRAQLATQFGGVEADLDKVERYGAKFNLMAAHRSAAERHIVLKGRLKDLLAAFPASVAEYDHPGGSYRGRRGKIHIPGGLDGIVTGVFGFDTRPKHRARLRTPRMVSLAGPGGANGVASTTFAKRYNFPTSSSGSALNGMGQTIAFIELGGGFIIQDADVYFSEIQMAPPQMSAVLVDHAGDTPTHNPAGPDGEVMLDIEVAGAAAPGAAQVVYFGPNKGSGMLDTVSAAVHDASRNPTIISVSWGGPEDGVDQQSITAFHEIFLAAAAIGMTVCTAAGDHGTADNDEQHWDGKIHVDHPSSDPLVLACGGTQIDDGKDVVWNDGTTLADGGWASGGGVSIVFPLPDYQKNAKVPPSLVNKKVGRGVPDIAMSATNYFERVDGTEGASGGTSAVAPLMAALVALLNQAKQKPVGFLNPFLYANAAAVTDDVTIGTNAIKKTTKGYAAGKGWDAASGLGTPDGTAILNTL